MTLTQARFAVKSQARAHTSVSLEIARHIAEQALAPVGATAFCASAVPERPATPQKSNVTNLDLQLARADRCPLITVPPSIFHSFIDCYRRLIDCYDPVAYYL
jgi:hypothetical protein